MGVEGTQLLGSRSQSGLCLTNTGRAFGLSRQLYNRIEGPKHMELIIIVPAIVAAVVGGLGYLAYILATGPET